MRNCLSDAPWWASAPISGAFFGGTMTLFQRFAYDASWTRSAITGVLEALFFGALMSPFLRRQQRELRAAVGPVPARLRSAARRASWRGPVPADPELRSAALRLVDYSLADLQRRQGFTLGTFTVFVVLATGLAVTSSGWFWLAAAFFAAMLVASLLIPVRLRRRRALLGGSPTAH